MFGRIEYTYMQGGLRCTSSILFVNLSERYFPRCAFFNERNNRFLKHGTCGQEGFCLSEELDDMRIEVLGEIDESDILQRIKSLVPEGFWRRN